MKLLHLSVQCTHGHSHDVRIGPMTVVVRHLGHDHDKRPEFVMRPKRIGEPYLRFIEPIGPALSRTM